MRTKWLGLAVTLMIAIIPSTRLHASAESSIRIAVAANFAPTLEALATTADQAPLFQASTGATGALATQILYGAPFDVFLAADYDRPQFLTSRGISDQAPACYAQGQLRLVGADSLDRLQSGGRIAIANPDIAPYGRAAEEVLNRFESPMQRITGANALQAYQFYLTGGVEFALIPASLSLDNGLKVPPEWHAPIEQFALVVAAKDHPNYAPARQFLDWLLSDDVQDALLSQGYLECTP